MSARTWINNNRMHKQKQPHLKSSMLATSCSVEHSFIMDHKVTQYSFLTGNMRVGYLRGVSMSCIQHTPTHNNGSISKNISTNIYNSYEFTHSSFASVYTHATQRNEHMITKKKRQRTRIVCFAPIINAITISAVAVVHSSG